MSMTVTFKILQTESNRNMNCSGRQRPKTLCAHDDVRYFTDNTQYNKALCQYHAPSAQPVVFNLESYSPIIV